MKKVLIATLIIVTCLVAVALAAEEGVKSPAEQAVDSISDTTVAECTDQVVVYYLHMNRRCVTCGKLEAYSKEAIEIGFVEQLKESSLLFEVKNFEVEGNEHFAKDYQLFSQSVILSRQQDGVETEWKNLDQIWKLVGDKEEFISYVQSEVASFISANNEE